MEAQDARPAAVDRGLSLREQAYDRIRQDIFEGALQPGDALSEARLAKAYGISRTPVREAIKQLSEVGLVRLVSQRGAFVADLSPHDVAEIYELREELDGLATRAAAGTLSDAEIEELAAETAEAQRLRASGDARAAFDLAVGTHRRITRAVRNGRLLRMLGQLEDESRRLSHLTFRSPGRLESALQEHVDIVAALARRDADAAERAMRAHLRADRDAAIGQLRGGRLS
jgi:DNA-binding GntR family transcriptional regulator